MTRRIAHLDMDAFYASVELLRYPGLRGAPVVVGGRNERRPAPRREGGWAFPRLRDYAGRGVVTTATYEARAFGVSSGMGLMKAAALAPEAILLPADFAAYRHHSNLFKAAVAGIAPRIEDRGIDEIYADLSDLPEEALPLGRRIKQAVRAATGLSCSIGITPNKLLSKIASDLDKPDGLTLLAPEDVPRRIWPLPVRKINGIGPKAAARLGELGIATIGGLAGADPHFLARHFSPGYVHWLREVSHGIDARPVVTDAQRKSFSRETTFDRDLHARHDRAILGEIFTALCVQVARDLQRRDYLGRTIGIKLRYADFRTVTRDLTLPGPTADAAAIRRAAEECLRRVPLDRRLRLLGVRVGGLVCGSDLRAGFDPPSQAELPFAVSAGRP